MVVPKKPLYYWTILITLTTIFFVYLTFINISVNQTYEKTKTYGNVKEVVAYSLLKKIEIESEPFICGGQLSSSEDNYEAINASAEVNNNSHKAAGWNDEDEDNTWTNIDGSNLYVYSVHLDKRLDPYHYVRIIGMIRGSFNQSFYCQISTTNATHHITKVTVTPIWSETWDQNDTNIYFNPVLLSCSIPNGQIPASVSLGTEPCRKRNNNNSFRIREKKITTTNTFTVCVKSLDFSEDISRRLIQWIEINRILGAERLEIYVKKVKKNVWRILKWYSLTYPSQIIVRRLRRIPERKHWKTSVSFLQNIWQKRRYEVIAYNNCFYNNIATSQFVVPLDIDEIIVPRNVFTWKSLLSDMFAFHPKLEENFASFTVLNAYFFGQLNIVNQNTIFFLANVNRSLLSPAGESGKSFISTKNSLTVFNHYALDVLRPGISRTYFIPSSLVQLNHYKETCNAVILPECEKYFSSPRVRDPVIVKYKDVFLYNYREKIAKMRSVGIL